MKILVTGGAGYIGSHTCIELLQAGYEIEIVDNLSNSKEEPLHRVQQLTGKPLKFHKVDLLDRLALERVFEKDSFDAVVHFAGLKAVGESVSQPLQYYHNNITGTLILCEVMEKYAVHKLVFSSSATVYGNPPEAPILESFPIAPTNPYGQTKAMIEQILADLQRSDPAWDIALLRYFNPIGAHTSGLIGEDPNGIPNNLVPYIAQVAVGKHPYVRVFGNDYPTPDGTGVRDYIHVTDLAAGHVKALEKLSAHPGLVTYNLGTGFGYSVIEVIEAFEEVCGKEIPYKVVERRPGDIPVSYASVEKARLELGWTARLGIAEMCADTWRWQSKNPQGYEE